MQQIYYGAPGTGKSHAINEQTEGESVIRTTFHPDSDYSTFVGAYKPTTKQITLRDMSGHPILEDGVVLKEDRIVYEFVDQAFLQAYVKAWKFYAENEADPKKQFLVIEEINRGNCAQIFGDLFQLLDRNEWGFSDYPINADKDMKKQLKKALAGLSIADAETINGLYKGRDVVKEVLEGDILLLPSNLYIWATMNTSDQSLFPIDSAFKRRWDWQYMPIAQGRDEAGKELAWTIDVNGSKYSWWSFLEKINAQIGEATQSEDKKLGFFFCKAKDGVITPETFVGKVVFYLWNDVFKDYGFEGSIFKDKDGTELSFNKFYAADLKGNAVVQKDKVELFLNNLKVDLASSEDETDGNDKVGMTIIYDGDEIREKNDLETYVKAIEKIGVERIAPLNITCYGQQVVGTEPPANYAWRTVNDYKILTFKLHRHMERILNEIAAGLQEDIKVTFE
ncbi:AAA family ATPase [Sodaliphilus sp.]|uniref:AAA family ATPase n=1 Tax=Sodaliphilus sp. TaxID=2815818 RepID=UPI00388F0542